MSFSGSPGRVVFWRHLTASPSLPADTWTGPTGFAGGRDDLPDEGKGPYSSGALPITGMGMVDVVFNATFSDGTTGRRLARVRLNDAVLGRSEDYSSQRCTCTVALPVFVKPGDVLTFEVYQTGAAGLGMETTQNSSYISVLSR